jgi:cellulase/cellobiase CelA1
LRLQFADGHHVALAGDQYRDEINIVVEQPGKCRIDYFIDNQWNSGFTGRVRVNNLGSRAIDGWRVSWSMPNGQHIIHLWNGAYAQNGADVTSIACRKRK